MSESTSFKRVLTDEIHNTTQATDQVSLASGTPNDVYLQLRNVGLRARKSVLEGYQTGPSSFSKAQSTGSIFRSMNDTMREVYAGSSASTSTANHSTSRKRARSVTELDLDQSEATATENSGMSVDNDLDSVTTSPRGASLLDSSRPIRPLRTSSHAFLETRSLPASTFSFSATSHAPRQVATTPTAEEADWSEDTFIQQSTHDFEPMLFE